MKTKPKLPLLLKLALPTALLVGGLATSRATRADGFCSHGTGRISEDGVSTSATVLLRGDFDGDGKTDKFCKDVRKHGSNQNRLLEWLVLGNGKEPLRGTWNEWCTHRNSGVFVERGTDKRDILVCEDTARGRWERDLAEELELPTPKPPKPETKPEPETEEEE
jgi:hypothetical protein